MALLVLLGGYFIRSALNEAGNVNAGDCIKVVSANATDAEIDVVDCASADATHKVGKNLASLSAQCPNGPYDEYTQPGNRSASVKLCLIPNLKAGDCFGASVTGPTTKAACGPDTIQITKVISAVDEAACGDDVAFSFPEPPTTFCGRPST
ncbi:MAG: LppU/SCO3897 family protein [Pseudonocardia sp.]